MFQFNVKLLLNNRILLVWPLTAIVAPFIIGFTGSAESAIASYSFVSGIFLFLAVISIPSHLNKNLKRDHAALLFSKPVSRSQFFFSEYGAVFAVTFLYSLIAAVAFTILHLLGTGTFPFQFFLGVIIFTPIYFIVVYITIFLLLLVTDSYLGSVLAGYIVIPLVSVYLLKSEKFLTMIGWDTDFLLLLSDILSYLIPSVMSIDLITQQIITKGFTAFDWQLFGFGLLSCIPFLLLSYYAMIRKEF